MPATKPISTSPTMLHGVKAGDPAEKKRLVEWAGPLVNHWCRQVNYQDREEIFQEVFAEVFDSVKKFKDGPGSSFRGWLRTITTSKIINLARQNERHKFATGGEAEYRRILEQAAQQVGKEDDNDAAILLRNALDQIRGEFAEHVWQAFWRTTSQDRSAPDVAKELQMSADAVRKAKQRVLYRLREVYGQLVE